MGEDRNSTMLTDMGSVAAVAPVSVMGEDRNTT